MTDSPVTGPVHGTWEPEPAARWEDAFLSGNGHHGTLVFGDPNDERVIVTHHTLVRPNGSEHARPPQLAAELPALQDRLLAGEPTAAETFTDGRDLQWVQPFHPAFQIRLRATRPAAPRRYRRFVDFTTGVATAECEGFSSRVFVSRADDVIVHHLSAPDLDIALDHRLPGAPHDLAVGHGAVLTPEGALLTLRARYPGSDRAYTGVTLVVVTGGSTSLTPPGLRVTGAKSVLLLTRVMRHTSGAAARHTGVAALHRLDGAAANAEGSAVSHAGGSAVSHADGSAVSHAGGSAVSHAGGSAVSPAGGPAVSPAGGPAVSPAGGPTVSPADGSAVSPADGSAVSPADGPTVSPADRPTASHSDRPAAQEPDALAHARALGDLLPDDEDPYAGLLARHTALHRTAYERATLDLDADPAERALPGSELLGHPDSPALLERLFAAGRYHLLSASGMLPPRLVGLWTGDWNTAWSGAFTNDANLNLQTASAAAAALPEVTEALASLIHRQLDDWSENARAVFGARGVVAPAHTDGESGLTYHFSREYPLHLWTAGADWLLKPLVDHDETRGERDPRTAHALARVALFYEDFLTRTDEDGHLVVVPSYSPENRPANASWGAINAAMDLSAARHALLTAAEYHPDLADRWRALADRLPPHRINADGALAEWARPGLDDTYDHRHLSHLYGVWPLDEITPYDTPDLVPRQATFAPSRRPARSPTALKAWEVPPLAAPAESPSTSSTKAFGRHAESTHRTPLLNGQTLPAGALAAAAHRALELRGPENDSAHGHLHHALVAARLRDGQRVAHALGQVLKGDFFHASLMSSHYPDRDVYNADAAHALPAVLIEMLVQSTPDRLVLLPALPTAYPKGELHGIRTRFGAGIDLTWSPHEATAVVRPTRTHRIELRTSSGAEPLDLVAGEERVLALRTW
ncbi:glycoside hydrolase N-terminal domain-containing protein [Streptomyces sp. NL15-2K]|uniref:glycosyl hydrolase family 95 catalytic domain-containing protein n=1 Tax=Streptomyces sp. NL15-2K TaxID=376149 RepID=UPI0026EE9D29|nr:glycoside hydrolase N-terminal domain-containing protein [Kutzneria buriramensis]WKX13030.1 glycoside hydrolase N-terminal domain-containing protein [Kutzneria buriramensis]